MRQFTIPEGGQGMRADRFLRKAASDLPASVLQKAFRLKDVKRNGRRCASDERLEAGDMLILYVKEPEKNALQLPIVNYQSSIDLDIRYEDKHILVLYKPAGLLSQANAQNEPSLENGMRAFLQSRDGFTPGADGFVPSLCHRLDRGTEGLLLAAKTPQALRILTEKIRNREITKTYRALVHGTPSPKKGMWEDILYKDPSRSFVTVCPRPRPGAKTALLSYTVLETRGNFSLLECRLITGRTHQIRVQCAHHGHPICGDGKYGREGSKKSGGRRYQALCAVSLTMDFTSPAGELEYLRGKIFSISEETILSF